MSVITYTALRKIATGHLASTQYSLEMPMQKIERSNKAQRTRHVAMSGIAETYLQRVDTLWALQTDFMSMLDQPRTNLAIKSEQFGDAAWTKTNVTVDADAETAPDGNSTADKIEESTTSSVAHSIELAAPPTVITGARVTYSVYALAAERTCVRLQVQDFVNGSNYFYADFDLAVGTKSAVTHSLAGVGVAEIEPIGGGWYRLSLSGITDALDTRPQPVMSILSAVGGSSTYAGTVGDGLYVWGAQLEVADSRTAYIPTDAAAVTEPSKLHAMREFMASVAGGESFSIDMYGTLWAPDDPIVCDLDSDDYSESREGKVFLAMGFRVREL